MAIKFQYNKTSLGDLGKQLKMRQKALPTIKSKESALRLSLIHILMCKVRNYFVIFEDNSDPTKN